MKRITTLLLIGCILIIISCLSPYEGVTEQPDEGTVEETSDLFTPSEEEATKGAIRFYTNDTRYRSTSGYTLWTHSDNTADVEPSVEVWKNAGSESAGCGLVLYSKRRMVNETEKLVFLTILINNRGEYTVGKVINALYTTVVPWTKSGHLKSGRGVPNRIRVAHDKEDPNKYNVYLNGAYAHYFIDGTAPYCEGVGRSGYMVVIAPTDLNNGGAVEVWFSE